ncbi:hypothetical protein LTR70_008291 [Exophiala xenobiotica]|nr:hypothetical protein LTR70_008291 [Exophiala xenobiotica]
MHGNAVDGYPGYLTNSSAAGETVTATPSTQQQTQARRDVLMFCAAVLTLMLGRDISAQDVLEVLSRCQHDQLMPALTFLFGIGTCGYIARASATQHYVTLEDAYGHPRTVTMDSCMDFDILRKFLEVHYRQTNGKAGEALIRAGRFHLMLGSRRGRVIDAQEWAVPGRIRAGSRVINSVYVIKPCQVYHRDYDTFRSTVGDKATLSQGREAEEQNEQRPYDGLSPLTGSELIRAEDFNSGSNTNYRIDGLQNVDVRIVARPKVHDYPYSRGVSSLRRSKRPSTNSSRNSMASNQNARLSRNRYPSILIPQNSWQEHDAIKDVALGTVKWLNDAKGFGFTIRGSGGENFFVHETSSWATQHRTLLEGERVKFFVFVIRQRGASTQQVMVLPKHDQEMYLRWFRDDPDTTAPNEDDEFESMVAGLEAE